MNHPNRSKHREIEAMLTTDDALSKIRGGEVLVSIGQITPDTKRHLDRLVRNGDIARWRGHWYPFAGAPFGLGPLKTCYGLHAVSHIQHMGD